jgi:hypothetical protein
MNTVPASTSTPTWSEADTATAKRIWAEYQQTHDVSALRGQAAGIDPRTGEVWFGEDAVDIQQQRKALGLKGQLLFERVGFDTYLRKGRRG